jgi:hypothetical protein
VAKAKFPSQPKPVRLEVVPFPIGMFPDSPPLGNAGNDFQVHLTTRSRHEHGPGQHPVTDATGKIPALSFPGSQHSPHIHELRHVVRIVIRSQ